MIYNYIKQYKPLEKVFFLIIWIKPIYKKKKKKKRNDKSSLKAKRS